MFKKFVVGMFALGLVTGIAAESRAQGPFEFQYGYTLGIQSSFRNRLPVPPYFSVYPPVYYGRRYERPYGESPFASWPLLQANPSYQPVPAVTRMAPPVLIENPFIGPTELEYMTKLKEAKALPSVATQPQMVQPLVVTNPFVQQEYVALK